MTANELRAAIAFLEQRVALAGPATPIAIVFSAPSAKDLAAIGLAEADAARLLDAPWWREMVAEIVETPSFAGPDDPPEVVLRYARDVVGEYIRKRLSPAG
jgi:hypothetical protein